MQRRQKTWLKHSMCAGLKQIRIYLRCLIYSSIRIRIYSSCLIYSLLFFQVREISMLFVLFDWKRNYSYLYKCPANFSFHLLVNFIFHLLVTPCLMLFSSLDKSSKQTANNYGLSTPPCLTPLDTWNGSEKRLPNFICIFCSLYQCFSKRTKHIGTFLWISSSNIFMFSTRSNAFEAS